MTSKVKVLEAIQESGFEITELVCGMAQGIDLIARGWALESGIPVKEFPAEWDLYGRAAGPRRNQQMAEYAEALIAIWDGKSSGTKNMITKAEKLGLGIHIHLVPDAL